jgi:hypothetical protein
MLRVLLGILKGGIVGGAVGLLATRLGLGDGITGYAVYGVVGFLVGIVCGKAIWRQETLWTPVLKGVVGVVVSLGLTWGARKLLGDFKLSFVTELGAPDAPVASVPLLLAPLVGIAYGIFVEVDDGDRKGTGSNEKKPTA